MSENQNNKRIAKNTLLLYIRMFISIIVSLYTSRVVLQTLGIEDFGIFGIVGGVVTMLSFINASMSGATSRYLTFALGKNNRDELKDTFSSALLIHISIAVLVVLLLETVGLWFVNNKLVIPEDRVFAANWVFQFSILATIAAIFQVPFNATIISHERMNAFAYIEIANVTLKLFIVFTLPTLPFDKLISYGALYMLVTYGICSAYILYCKKNFDICTISKHIRTDIIKPMLVYCSWDLYGNLSGTARQQGTNFIINIFFGVTLNAASAVATQVQSAVSGLAANVIQAFRPQIIKNYAAGNFILMESQICNAIKYTLLIYGMCVLPLFLELDYVLHLWLGVVPDYAVVFCRILLLNSMIGLATMILITANHATGNIKYLSIVTGTLNLLTIPCIYYTYLYFGPVPEYAYYVGIAFSLFVLTFDIGLTKKMIPLLNVYRIAKNILIPLLVILLATIPLCFILNYIETSFVRLVSVTICSVITHLLITYIFVIDSQLRGFVNSKIKRIVHHV